MIEFAAGVETQTITLEIIDDGLIELQESAAIVLYEATNGSFPEGKDYDQGILTIIDNDASATFVEPENAVFFTSATDVLGGTAGSADVFVFDWNDLINGSQADTITGFETDRDEIIFINVPEGWEVSAHWGVNNPTTGFLEFRQGVFTGTITLEQTVITQDVGVELTLYNEQLQFVTASAISDFWI